MILRYLAFLAAFNAVFWLGWFAFGIHPSFGEESLVIVATIFAIGASECVR